MTTDTTLTIAAGAALLALWAVRALRTRRHSRPAGSPRATRKPAAQRSGSHAPKPPWVRGEVVRLKAWMPHAGCRTVALTFNHLHEQRRDMTVGKSFVAGVLRDSGEEVMRTRRKLRRRRPRRLARNVLWGLDWTFVPGRNGQPLAVLGVIDCGSRACMELAPVESRRTITVLRQLFQLFERFGKPKVLRTDNDAAFRSRLFRLVLRLVGVRHVRTAPFAPWQNGRMERMFGTMKRVLRLRAAVGGEETVSADDLQLIRTWYNHLRPHQGLEGRTPAEAWNGRETDRRRRPVWISEWGGVLSGYYWPR